MVPGAKDCDYTRGEPPLTAKQIRDFKESYEDYRFVDSEHEITRTGKTRGEKYDSYLLSDDTELELYDGTSQTYPRGTWMMTSHVTDQEAIQTALNGGYTGYSPAVRSHETADKFKQLINDHAYEDAEALKSQSQSGLIRDIPNPVVLSVTLTKKPCLHASKYCKLKKDTGEMMSEETTKIKTKVLAALGMSEEADVEALKSEVADIHTAIDTMKTENAEALKSMKEEITTAFTEALKEAFADKAQKEDEDDDEVDGNTSNEGEGEASTTEEDDNKADENNKEDDDDKKAADKSIVDTHGKSKAKPNHNANTDGSDKSEILDTYAFLGRNPDGTRKRV